MTARKDEDGTRESSEPQAREIRPEKKRDTGSGLVVEILRYDRPIAGISGATATTAATATSFAAAVSA